MLRHMRDTNTLNYTIKGLTEAVRHKIEAHEAEICTSSVAAMELLYGAHKSQSVCRNLDVIGGVPARLAVLDFDLAAAEHAGAIRATLASGGRPLGPCDAMIAGHARPMGLTLVTNNISGIGRVAGLRLANWAE